MWFFSLVGLLFLLGAFLLWLSHRQTRAAGLPGGKVIYSDTRGWGLVKEPLYDPLLGVTGKPDYLVAHRDQVVPVEVKSSRAAYGPYDAHILQLAVYCLLVERQFGKRPPYGILHYPNRTYRIDYTAELERATREIIAQMRQQEFQRELHRSHESPARCRGCGYRSICPEKLNPV